MSKPDTHQDSNRPLCGKTAIVSGGASGIGLATWQEFVRRGAKVLVTDIQSPPETNPIPANCRFLHHDVRDRDGWRTVVDLAQSAFGSVHILVNAAGILREGSMETTDLATWTDMIGINVEGTFWGCQAVVPAMAKSGSGSIINLSSVSGLRADAQLAAYCASKSAVLSLTRDLAAYCAAQDIPVRCNTVHPGVVETPMIDTFFRSAITSTRTEWIASQPIGRSIQADEVACLIAWLASDAARYVTGAEYVIDGGLTA